MPTLLSILLHSTNSPILSSFSGLPKLRQLVIAIGVAPTEIKFLQLSATTCLPPVKGCAQQYTGGLHVSAVQKDPKTYEHVNPEEVGNNRNIVISDQSGKSNIISRLKTININIDENDPKIKKLLNEVKDREFIG